MQSFYTPQSAACEAHADLQFGPLRSKLKMSEYYSERAKLREFCSNKNTFEAADRTLFFTKVKAKLKELKLKVDCFIYYTQANCNYDCYDLAGSVPRQRKTKKYQQSLYLFDTWLEDVLYCYNQSANYISRDCDTQITRWEINLVNYTLSYTYLEFKMSQTSTEKSIGWTVEIPVSFKQTPSLISNNLWQTKAFISLFKYQNPQEAWELVKADLLQSLEQLKTAPVWYELQDEVESLPKWDLNLSLPLRSIGEWLAERYEGTQDNEDPEVIFVFKN